MVAPAMRVSVWWTRVADNGAARGRR